MPHPTIIAADPYQAVTTRWSWDSDDTFAHRVEATRLRSADKRGSLRAAVDLLDLLDVPMPDVGLNYDDLADWHLRWWANDVDGARAIRRAIGSPAGPWEKGTQGGRLSVTCVVSRVRLTVFVDGQTCDRVVVGEETVEATVEVCPTCEADLSSADGATVCSADCGYEARPAKRVVREVVRDVVEWVCPDLNGGDA
jgi:hypothetical protein